MIIHNSFDKGPEGWCSYDYHASIVAGGHNIFILTTWAREGGVANSGYVWADHSRWSTDTPERPVSILPLLFYRHWINEDPLDLRGAEVSVYLRGDNLDLGDAQCYFWVVGNGGRWHLTSQPLTISQGVWASEAQRVTLDNDPSRWHNSWSGHIPNPKPLESVLSRVVSYGFSFVGMRYEVSGRLSMDEFQIRLPAPAHP